MKNLIIALFFLILLVGAAFAVNSHSVGVVGVPSAEKKANCPPSACVKKDVSVHNTGMSVKAGGQCSKTKRSCSKSM